MTHLQDRQLVQLLLLREPTVPARQTRGGTPAEVAAGGRLEGESGGTCLTSLQRLHLVELAPVDHTADRRLYGEGGAVTGGLGVELHASTQAPSKGP